jgi:hypothetical protein
VNVVVESPVVRLTGPIVQLSKRNIGVTLVGTSIPSHVRASFELSVIFGNKGAITSVIHVNLQNQEE